MKNLIKCDLLGRHKVRRKLIPGIYNDDICRIESKEVKFLIDIFSLNTSFAKQNYKALERS